MKKNLFIAGVILLVALCLVMGLISGRNEPEVSSLVTEPTQERAIPTTIPEPTLTPTPEWCNPIDGALYAEGVITVLQWLDVENEKIGNNLEFEILPRDPEIAIADEILKAYNELDPPPCLEETHTYYIEAVTLWRQGVLYLSVGEFTLAFATINEATELMILGGEKLQEMIEREGLL